MPKTVNKRKPAPGTRKSADRRKDEARARRKGSNGATAPAPAVIADSFSALTVKAKPGIAVEQNKSSTRRHSYGHDEDYEQMYSDLLACLHHALKLTGETSTFDPMANGMDLSVSIYYVVNCFKTNILPKGYDVNIDRHEGCNDNGYYFTIFKECENNTFWHAFEVKPVAAAVAKDKKLHQFFIEVLKCMYSKADISGWWDGGMGYADYMLDEEISNYNDNYPEDDDEDDEFRRVDDFNEMLAAQRSYSTGEAKRYEDLIRNCKFVKPEDLARKLKRFDAKHPLVKWIGEAIEFLKLNGSVSDFVYDEMENDDGLKFDQQVNLVFDFEDAYSRMQGESLDAEAQGVGVQFPILNLPVTPNLKSLDFNEMEQRSKWPMELSKIYSSYQRVTDLYTPKDNDKHQNGYFA